MVVAGIMWTISLSVLGALMILVWVDHSHGAIFSGTSDAFGQMQWFFRQPQIYAVAIPALGILGDIVTTFTRTRDDFRRSVAMAMIGAFGIFSFGAYTVLSYGVFAEESVPVMSYDNPVVIVVSILVVFPVLGLVGLNLDKFVRGRAGGFPVKAAPLPGAVVALVLLTLGVVLGIFTSFRSLDLHGTLFDDAVIQLVIGATIAAGSAAMFHWASKIGGANALNAMGMVAAILAGLGSGAIALADVLAAITGSEQQHLHGTTGLNTLAVVGWAAFAGTVFLTIVALLVAVKRYVDSDVETEADPWGVGQSLEWATASPPLYENFVELPPVTSDAPLLDELTPNEVDVEVAR
jgi:cytochrome c oxidase subunit 1